MTPSSFSSSPKRNLFALSEADIYPAALPKIIPNTGDPKNIPAAPPKIAPFEVFGNCFFTNSEIFSGTKPFFSSLPNNRSCTFLDLITNPAAAPIPAPKIGPTKAPVNTETPAPIKAPAPIAPLLTPASFMPVSISFLIPSSSFSSTTIAEFPNLSA